MTDNTKGGSAERKAVEQARKCAPCWGDGVAGPRECDESFDCELHSRIAGAILNAEQAAFERGRKEEKESWLNILPPQFELAKKEGFFACRAKAVECIRKHKEWCIGECTCELDNDIEKLTPEGGR